MILIIQAEVAEIEGEETLEWLIDSLPEEIRKRLEDTLGDVDFHLSQIKGRLGRDLELGERLAISGELDGGRFFYGQVEPVGDEPFTEDELAELFGPARKQERVGLWLWAMDDHLNRCEKWSEGEANQNTEHRTYGYKCGCGRQFDIHTGLVMWATAHDGCLPPGFTEKMRFLSIRGDYWATLARGEHIIQGIVRYKAAGGWNFGREDPPMYYEKLGTTDQAPPVHCKTWTLPLADLKGYKKLTKAWALELKIPQIKGVKVDLRDEDPFKTVVTITCTQIREVWNEPEEAEGGEGREEEAGSQEGGSGKRPDLRVV